MSQEFVSVPREWLTQVSLMQMSHEELQDQAVEFLCEPCDEPAPPSGGEPEESLEYRLACLGSIDRCDVACGSYGDKFQRWDDAGPYVEYDDHLRHIEFYTGEVERLHHNVTRLQAENAELQQRLTIADHRVDDLQHQHSQSLEVNPHSLRVVLTALVGASHEIRELQACRGLPDNPIDQLLREYNAWIEKSTPATPQ
jgi:hypothetical protein